MTVSGSVTAAVAALVVLCGCAGTPDKKDASQPQQQAERQTYKPTGSHIVERSDGKRSPKNSSSAPVQDLKDSPAVNVLQNQPPK